MHRFVFDLVMIECFNLHNIENLVLALFITLHQVFKNLRSTYIHNPPISVLYIRGIDRCVVAI